MLMMMIIMMMMIDDGFGDVIMIMIDKGYLYPLFSLEKKGILILCQSRSVVRPSVRTSVRHVSCKCISS